MPDQTIAEKSENWESVAEQLSKGFIDVWVKSDVSKALVGTAADVIGALLATAVTAMSPVGIGLAKGIAQSENLVAPALSEMAAAAANDLFNTNIPSSAFAGGMGSGSRGRAAAPMATAFMKLITGDGAALEASTAPAAKYLEGMVGMALEGWYQKWFFEFLTSLIPQLDIGKIENFGSLDDKLANALGLAGVSRRIVRPLVDAAIVTPLEWHTSKTYRPRLLTPATIGRQLARGKWSEDQAYEELARQGYSNDRIEALLSAGARAHSVADYDLMIRAGLVNKGTAVAALTDSGWTAGAAEEELLIEQVKGIAAFERAMANAAVDAFVAGRISEGELAGFATGTTIGGQDKAQIVELAQARRLLGSRPLTSGEAEQCVKAGVLSLIDYRAALRRENRTEDAIDALDLLLRAELDRARSVADHAADLAAEKARAAEAAAAARQAKLDEAARRQALARRGTEGDLERAAIRGLIPLSRVEELYAAKYDGDTVAILLEDLEARRQVYLAAEQRRADAVKRAAARGVSVAQLEAAGLAGVLTVDEIRGRLLDLKFAPGDVGILLDTLEARIADRDAARALREAAAAAAKRRQLNLSTMEALVRRGHRSLGEYAAFVAALGFDEAAQAALVDLLQDRIDEDAAARAAREAAAAAAPAPGLTLAQYRRAVLLGIRTIDAFQLYLVDRRYTADAQIVLTEELRADVAEAEAARRRRADTDPGVDTGGIPLTRVTRAARLGIISIAEYRARLAAAGYSADDIALDVDLLVEEMAADAATRARRLEVAADAATRDPTLAQLEAAVRAGLRSIDEYAARLVALGYGPDDVALLVALLVLELSGVDDAAAFRPGG